MTLALLLFWLGVAASVVGIVGIILCEYRTAKRKAVKRRRDAEDLAAANRIMATWAPKPKWNERSSDGAFRKKAYARFPAPKNFIPPIHERN